LAKKPFVVLDAEILSSSVWSEAAHVRLVWITMLILCDTEGYVGAALPGIARAAGVTLEEAEEALGRLQQPDPHSRTKSYEGRRVTEADRGWRILNFLEHLDHLSAARKQARDRVFRFRQRKKAREAAAREAAVMESNATVTDGHVTVVAGSREQGVGNRDVITDPPLRVGESEATPDPPPVVVDAVVSDGLIQSVGETVPRELALVSSEPSESDGARLVFDYWREQTGHSRAQWTPERAKALRDRLREEPGTMSQKIAGLMLVVDGALLDPLFNGTEKGTPYLDFENLFVHKGRNRIEKLQNIARRGGQRAPQSDRSRETVASIKAGILGGMK